MLVITPNAPVDASYVVIAANSVLTSERILTGTTNQVIVTDGGAGGNVTLSLPQDIHTGASPVFVGLRLSGHTSGRVFYSSIGGILATSANLTFDGNTLSMPNATTTSTGIVVGSTNRLYQSVAPSGSGNTAIPATVRFNNGNWLVNSATMTNTSANQAAFLVQKQANWTSAATSRCWGLNFNVSSNGSAGSSDGTSGVVGVEGSTSFTPTGAATMTAMTAAILFNSINDNATVTRYAGLDAYGADVTGSAVGGICTEGIGIIARLGRAAGRGTITTNYGVQLRAATVSGTGVITTQYGLAIASGQTLSAITANNQVRKFIEIPTMPTAGAFTGTIIAGIYFNSSSGLTTDGLNWNNDTLLYRSAADTLSLGTSDSLQILRGNIITDASVGMKIGTAITQLLGFWNATPVAQSTGWSVTNVSTDKAYDANSTTLDEIADVLGTLINQLKTYGLLGA